MKICSEFDQLYLSIMRGRDNEMGGWQTVARNFVFGRLPWMRNQLIEAIRERAARPELRNDFAHLFGAEVSAPAKTAAVDGAERAIGYALHPFHRRLLTEVGNGGFGPGYGLVGLPGGISDVDGRSLVELSRMLLLELSASPPFPVSFLCDWGCGVWGCIDCETGAVLTIAEDGLKDSGQTICAWFEDWVSGRRSLAKGLQRRATDCAKPIDKIT